MKRETKCPEYLIMRQFPSAGIYQVFSGPEMFYFHQIGDKRGGIDKSKLLAASPKEAGFKKTDGKDYSLAKKDIRRISVCLRKTDESSGHEQLQISFFTDKKHKFALLPSGEEENIDLFFVDVYDVVETPWSKAEKRIKEKRREEDSYILSSGRSPELFRRLLAVSNAVFVIGLMSSVFMLFSAATGWVAFYLFSSVCMLCFLSMLVIAFVYPDYYSVRQLSLLISKQIHEVSLSFVPHLIVSGSVLAFWTRMTKYMDWGWFWTISGMLAFGVMIATFKRVGLSFILCLVLLVGCAGIVNQLNYNLDMKMPEKETVEVVDKKTYRVYKAGLQTYYCFVRRDDGTILKIEVPSYEWDRINIGDWHLLYIYYGGLGLKNLELASIDPWDDQISRMQGEALRSAR